MRSRVKNKMVLSTRLNNGAQWFNIVPSILLWIMRERESLWTEISFIKPQPNKLLELISMSL